MNADNNRRGLGLFVRKLIKKSETDQPKVTPSGSPHQLGSEKLGMQLEWNTREGVFSIVFKNMSIKKYRCKLPYIKNAA